MGLLQNIGNKLFKRSSVSSHIGEANNRSVRNRTSLRLKSKKLTYKTGKKILRDTQVSTGYDILKYILSSKQWVLIANEEDGAEEVNDFIEDMLFNMETEVTDLVKHIIPGILWGFSINELIFDVNDDGKIYLKNTLPVHIKTLQDEPFVYNDAGELIAIHQEYDREAVDIPINKVLKYSFNANYDEDEGNGLLHDFAPIVDDKLAINDWLMTYLEKNEAPTLYGKTNSPVSRDSLLDAFDNIVDGTTGIVVGADDDIGVLESSHRGEAFFQTLQYKDNQIFRRYYLGNLLLGDNSQTGTYAQSKTQLDFGQLIFDGILEEIANCIQQQIINPIVAANYGSIDLAPTFSFDKFTTGDLQALMTTIKPLIDSGIIDSENKAVQDSIGLLFKQETGLTYVNESEPIEEDFNMVPNGETATTDVINELEGIYNEPRETDKTRD